MSKFLKVTNGDYKISVQEGGEIILDTGDQTGTVIISGDLEVRGEQTVINTTSLTVEDNIIELNVVVDTETDTTSVKSLIESGIRFNRNNLPDGLFTFNENMNWNDPVSQQVVSGGFVFKDINDRLIGIRTNSITTDGGDLYLLNTGTGVLNVSGTSDYERQIFDYDPVTGIQGTIVNGEDDTIPNTRAVVDYVDFTLQNVFQPSIGDGITDPTSVITSSIENTGTESFIDFRVDDIRVAQFFRERLELNDIRIEGSSIQTINSNTDLELSVPGTGSIVLRDILEIPSVPHIEDATMSPTAPVSGTKIYMNTENYGNTGIYYVNSDNTRDELVSTNRSILYSMIF